MIIIVLLSFFLYIFVSFWILFTSSLWTLYFGLELQWMLLTIYIIIGSSVWRGLLNYLMLNGILSIWLIIGILLSNSLFFILGCFGKVGYFPFFLILGYQYYSSSYLWMVFDLINKWAILGSFIFIIHLSMNFGYWFVLVNFLVIIFFIKFVLSIKHLILISSLQLFLFILCGLYFEDELFSFSGLLFYSITTINILWDCLWLDRINDAFICVISSVFINNHNNNNYFYININYNYINLYYTNYYYLHYYYNYLYYYYNYSNYYTYYYNYRNSNRKKGAP